MYGLCFWRIINTNTFATLPPWSYWLELNCFVAIWLTERSFSFFRHPFSSYFSKVHTLFHIYFCSSHILRVIIPLYVQRSVTWMTVLIEQSQISYLKSFLLFLCYGYLNFPYCDRVESWNVRFSVQKIDPRVVSWAFSRGCTSLVQAGDNYIKPICFIICYRRYFSSPIEQSFAPWRVIRPVLAARRVWM